MRNDIYFWELQRTLSTEFSKYVLSHPEIDAQIPDNALIIFQIKGNSEFNGWSKRINLLQRELKQAVITVKIDNLAPPLESRLVNPHLVNA